MRIHTLANDRAVLGKSRRGRPESPVAVDPVAYMDLIAVTGDAVAQLLSRSRVEAELRQIVSRLARSRRAVIDSAASNKRRRA